MATTYITLFILFWWCFQGYFLYLYFFRLPPGKKGKAIDASDWPKFFIIVPTYDEEALIAKKIDNLRRLDYPNYEVCFVDASVYS